MKQLMDIQYFYGAGTFVKPPGPPCTVMVECVPTDDRLYALRGSGGGAHLLDMKVSI
jgi:hypothetical protein